MKVRKWPSFKVVLVILLIFYAQLSYGQSTLLSIKKGKEGKKTWAYFTFSSKVSWVGVSKPEANKISIYIRGNVGDYEQSEILLEDETSSWLHIKQISNKPLIFRTDIHCEDTQPMGILNKNRFIMFKTYNLTPDMQLKIDDVDWRSNIMNISKIKGWDSEWVQLNKNKGTDWGSHQTDSINKETWYRITNNLGFGLYNDYGSDDPEFLGIRRNKGIEDHVILEPLLIHQHHLPWDYFASLGHSPLTNKKNHSIMNVWNDISGRVPETGSCQIWDGGDQSKMTQEECDKWRSYDEYFIKSGGNPKYLEPRFDYYNKNCYYL